MREECSNNADIWGYAQQLGESLMCFMCVSTKIGLLASAWRQIPWNVVQMCTTNICPRSRTVISEGCSIHAVFWDFAEQQGESMICSMCVTTNIGFPASA